MRRSPFPLNKWNTGDQVRISLRLYLCLLHDLQLTLSLNGQAVGKESIFLGHGPEDDGCEG